MSEQKFEFDIDDILAEFYSNLADAVTSLPAEEVPAYPAGSTVPAEGGPAPTAEGYVSAENYVPADGYAPAENYVPASGSYAPPETDSYVPPEEPAPSGRRSGKKNGRREKAPAPVREEQEASGGQDWEDEEEDEEAPGRSRAAKILLGVFRTVLSIVFAGISLMVLGWMLLNVHPDPETPAAAPAGSRMDLMAEFDNFANNAASDALSGLTYIPKIYTIPENALAAPAPDQARFGSTEDPWEIMDLIDSAAGLLNGQEVTFDPEADFQPDRPIRYYYDETILAITWKEIIEGKCCSCAEIKIADGSQIRRKLSGDSYGSSIQLYASDMAKAANAVVAINGDFYAFRPIGITAYQRQIYRCNSPTLDTCFFTASGDMLFSYAGEHTDWDETQQFVDDNDVVWAITFGPVLVDNGELRQVESYPIGEVNTTYSRAAIGMLDELHYFLMTVNYDDGYSVAATLGQMAQFMYGKNCQKAYALDGGQTSILLMNGEWVNHVDFGYERTMSDIIYFGTALPAEEAEKS